MQRYDLHIPSPNCFQLLKKNVYCTELNYMRTFHHTYISYHFGRSTESVVETTVRHETCQRKYDRTYQQNR